MATVKVWDPLVRIFHWALVASFAVAFLVGEERDLRTLHLWAGYSAAALVALRHARDDKGVRVEFFIDPSSGNPVGTSLKAPTT